METIDYPYRPKPWIMLLAAAFFAVIAVFMVREALTNDRGLILNGIIEFTPGGASIFYWCVAGVSIMFVAAGMVGLVASFVSKHRLTLTAEEISAPRSSFSRQPTVVRIADIRQIAIQMVQKQRFLYVYHSGGKLTIAQSMLPDAQAFETIHAFLSRHVGGMAKA